MARNPDGLCSSGACLSAITVVDEMHAQPAGQGWIFARTWHCVGHPQSGMNWTLAVGQYAVMDLEEAVAEVDRLGLRTLADKQIFGVWCNAGLVH